MSAALHVYVLITAARVRLYTTHARALKVCQRARRMGIKVEFTSDIVRRGDPYRRAKLEPISWGVVGDCCAEAV